MRVLRQAHRFVVLQPGQRRGREFCRGEDFPVKLWRRMRDESSDLPRVLGQGVAQSLREMLQFLSRYAKPRSGKKHPSTLQRLEAAAEEARQVIFKDPLGYVRGGQKTIAEGRKAFARSLESYKVKLNSGKLSDQRTVSLP
jgi:hypothetical protein